MTLIVILNAVLAVSILSVIVALHTRAILADQREQQRQLILTAGASERLTRISPAPRSAQQQDRLAA